MPREFLGGLAAVALRCSRHDSHPMPNDGAAVFADHILAASALEHLGVSGFKRADTGFLAEILGRELRRREADDLAIREFAIPTLNGINVDFPVPASPCTSAKRYLSNSHTASCSSLKVIPSADSSSAIARARARASKSGSICFASSVARSKTKASSASWASVV